MKTTCFLTRWMSASAVVAFFVTLIQSPLAKVLDDFNDNKVTGWEKFDFGSGKLSKIGVFPKLFVASEA